MGEDPGSVLAAARERKVFSAAAWSVGTADSVLDRGILGTRRWGGPPADERSAWDLASLTKPVVGLAVMALVDRGALSLDDTVGDHLAAYRSTDKTPLAVRQLLSHTSGLPGGTPLYRDCPTRADLLRAIGTRPLARAPGTAVEYSSQGFILLGLIAEHAAGRGLDALVRGTVCEPIGMRDTGFGADPADSVATEDCPWRGRIVTGEVHDENAVVLGGICGHAGLFSTLADLERLGRELVRGAPSVLRPATFELMTAPATDHLNLRRSLAWQGQDAAGSPVGPDLPADSYGHTGFTGTSIWIEPRRGRYYVLLTNRVHPSRNGPSIGAVRTAFHSVAADL